VFFIFDGVSLNQQYNGERFGPVRNPERYNFLRGYLGNISAEEIKGIEVMTRQGYAETYFFNYVGPLTGALPPVAFIEITSRAGHGPNIKATPGTYLYRPLPFTLPKDFYRPKYTAKNKAIGIGTDLRSTIHWEPNIMTDVDGRAIVSFYAADKPAGYTIIMEGTDFGGNFGYARKRIKVIR